jgi:hypothetical protein
LLQAGGQIDAVAVPIVVLDDHVAKIDPDPYVDALVVGQTEVALPHRGLQLDCALDGSHRARKFGEEAVAHQFEDVAVQRQDLRFEQLLAMRLYAREGPLLVDAHEAAVTDHVGGEDRRQATLHGRLPFFGQGHPE